MILSQNLELTLLFSSNSWKNLMRLALRISYFDPTPIYLYDARLVTQYPKFVQASFQLNLKHETKMNHNIIGYPLVYQLIEIMNNVREYGALLSTEMISSIHIHFYRGKQMTFVNTILHQSSKLIAPNIAPKYQCHEDPQNLIAQLPFCVVNQAHLKQKNDTYKLIITLLRLSQGRRQQAQPREIEVNQSTFQLWSVLLQCEELSQVSTLLNFDYLNPYWILLNPILKMRQNASLQKLKKKILSKTQFFKNGEEFNECYFIYRLNLLQNYIRQLKRERFSLFNGKFIKICLIALLKHFKENSPQLYNLAITQPLFEEVNQNYISYLDDLKLYQQKLIDDGVKANGAYGFFQLPVGEHKQQQKQEYQTMRQKFMKSLVKPLSVTTVLLILGTFLSF